MSPDEALGLLRDAETAELMWRANQARRDRHGNRTHFVHSLNLNPGNVCENRCELCAFWREADAPDAYMLSLAEVREHLTAAQSLELTELHVVGGLSAAQDLPYFESLMHASRELLPNAFIQGMTAVEVHSLAAGAGLSIDETLKRLKDAGMGSLSGGGAEIFADEVRSRICSRKISGEQWLAVHEQAHGVGLPTNATMLFGHLEGPEDIVDHLERLRSLQDRTGGFQAFIPLPFHAEGTRLDVPRGPGGDTVARVVSLARLYLDNFLHIRVLANYLDRKLMEVLTACGVDDVGGTSLDERIVRAAGAPDDHRISSVDEMTSLLRGLGLDPVLTNSIYEPLTQPEATEQTRKKPPPAPIATDRLDEALRRAEGGVRLSVEDATVLHDEAPFQQLGLLAHRRRVEMLPDPMATFVLDRNISITNVCEAGCRFCAFHVPPGDPGAFVLSHEQILAKVRGAVAQGATQIMLQGGLNPALDLAFYEQMLSKIKAEADLCLHSLSPAEICYLAERSGLSVRQVLQRLRRAGLDSLPGGGAEILVDEVRERVSPRKISADAWFETMETAHDLGMKTTATMVYGLGETGAQRVEHLMRIRELQDRTGGFTAFIPWSFQPNRTQLSLRRQTGPEYLRVVALARLVLDNIPHIQAGWVTEGPDLAQLALAYGADDFGGVLMEERVVRATGVAYSVTQQQVISLIHEAAMAAAQRTTQYEILHIFDRPAS